MCIYWYTDLRWRINAYYMLVRYLHKYMLYCFTLSLNCERYLPRVCFFVFLFIPITIFLPGGRNNLSDNKRFLYCFLDACYILIILCSNFAVVGKNVSISALLYIVTQKVILVFVSRPYGLTPNWFRSAQKLDPNQLNDLIVIIEEFLTKRRVEELSNHENDFDIYSVVLYFWITRGTCGRSYGKDYTCSFYSIRRSDGHSDSTRLWDWYVSFTALSIRNTLPVWNK